MNHVQACVLVPGPLRAVEESLRHTIRVLCGETGATMLTLCAPGADGPCAAEIRLHLDAAYGSACDRGEMLGLSWAPAPDSQYPSFTGTLLIWGLDAQSSWMGLDGVYSCAGGLPAGASERAREREAALQIAFAVLRCFEASPAGDGVCRSGLKVSA